MKRTWRIEVVRGTEESLVRSAKMWRRHEFETHGRAEIKVVEVNVGKRVQVVSSVGRVLGRCGGIQIDARKIMNMRDECKVKSGVQIAIFAGRH